MWLGGRVEWGVLCWGGGSWLQGVGRGLLPLGASVALRGHLVVREGSAFGWLGWEGWVKKLTGGR